MRLLIGIRLLVLASLASLPLSCKESPGTPDGSVEDDGSGGGDPGPFTACVNVRPYTRSDPSNFAVIPGSGAAEPARGACVKDVPFGSEVCKVADARQFASSEIGSVLRPVYSRWPIVSSSGEHYFLVKDGETPPSSGTGQMVIFKSADDSVHRVVSEASSDEGAEFRWDQSGSRPNVLYYRQDCALREYDANTGATQLIHDFTAEFPTCGRILNDVEGDASVNTHFWAFMVQGQYDGESYPMLALVTYDRTTDQLLGTLDLTRYHALGGVGELPRPNMVDVSPLGTKAVALFPRTDRGDAFDGPHAFNLDFTGPVKVCNDESHSGWAFDGTGAEVYVCQVTNSNWPNAEADTLVYTDILTGVTQTMLYHEDLGWDVGGFHFGRFTDPAIRGWMFMSTYSETATSGSFLRNQLVMVEVKPHSEHPRVWRIADTHNTYPADDGYPREAYAPISPDGRTLYWGSDWPGGDGTVDTYRVILPERWWERLGELAVCE